MEVLNVILGLVAAFLGYPIGLLLSKIAKEEIKLGQKYFLIMQKIVFILLIISLFFKNIILIYSLLFLFLLSTAARGTKLRHLLLLIILEIITIPTLFMGKKANAKYHLKFVCPLCLDIRKKHRDVRGNKTCWWESNWKKGNYNIPRYFGPTNWIKQYFGFKTNLKRYKR